MPSGKMSRGALLLLVTVEAWAEGWGGEATCPGAIVVLLGR